MEFLDHDMSMEKMMAEKAMRIGAPLTGSLELLPLCNMNCDMCYVRLDHKEMEKLRQIPSLEAWLELARQMMSEGVLFLLLTGGEPLLYPDFKELYVNLQQMGFILTVNTNGTLIDDEWVCFFSEHKPRRINITLYGDSEQVYEKLCHYKQGYTKTIQAIEGLRAKGVDVRIGSTLTNANYESAENIKRISVETGSAVDFETYVMPACRERNKEFSFLSRMEPKRAAEMARKAHLMSRDAMNYYEFVKGIVELADHNGEREPSPCGIQCMAGRCGFTVNWTGKIRPCVMLNTPEINVFKQGFAKSWKYLSENSALIKTSEKCSVCEKRHICRTCAAAELYEEGSFGKAPAYLCEYAEELLSLYRKDLAYLEGESGGE